MNPSLTDYVATILLIRPLMQSLLIFVLPERKLVSLETSLRKQSSYMGTYFYLYFFWRLLGCSVKQRADDVYGHFSDLPTETNLDWLSLILWKAGLFVVSIHPFSSS